MPTELPGSTVSNIPGIYSIYMIIYTGIYIYIYIYISNRRHGQPVEGTMRTDEQNLYGVPTVQSSMGHRVKRTASWTQNILAAMRHASIFLNLFTSPSTRSNQLYATRYWSTWYGLLLLSIARNNARLTMHSMSTRCASRISWVTVERERSELRMDRRGSPGFARFVIPRVRASSKPQI